MDVIIREWTNDLVKQRDFYELKEQVVHQKDLTELSGKVSYCLSHIVPMSDKMETLSRNNMEIKWDCKRMEDDINTKVDKDMLIMVESK